MESTNPTSAPRVTRAAQIAAKSAYLRANPNIRGRIAALLNLPLDGPWSVVDSDLTTSVYLVSYQLRSAATGKPAYMMQDRIRPPPRYQNLRGVVVALGDSSEQDRILINNYVFTPRARSTETSGQLVPAGTMVTVTTQYGDRATIDLTAAKVRRYREGVIIRLFRYGGVTYFATSSRLQAMTGMWAPSAPNFYQMYLDMGGRPLEELFVDVETHPYFYSLLLAHPGIQVASLADPFGIVLLEMGLMAGQSPELSSADQVAAQAVTSFVTSPKDLTLAEANRHLLLGTLPAEQEDTFTASPDPRLGLGEAIMITVPAHNGQAAQSYKVESPAYEWRFDVHGNQSSYYSRFITLLGARTLGLSEYLAAWPDLVSLIPPGGLDGPGRNINTIWGKTYNIYLCLIQASPFHRRAEMANVIVRLFGQAPIVGTMIDADGNTIEYRNYLEDPRDGRYEGNDAVPGVVMETGDMISLENYLADCYQRWVQGQLLEEVDGTTMYILNSVADKIRQSSRNWGTEAASQPDNKRNYFIHQMLYQPTGSFNVSGPGLNRVFKEMRTAAELAKKPASYIVPGRYHQPGTRKRAQVRLDGSYPSGVTFTDPAMAQAAAAAAVSPKGVTFGDFN